MNQLEAAVSHLLYILPALACPVGMVLMMVLMGRGTKRKDGDGAAESTESVDELRVQHDRLGEQIEQLERERLERRRIANR